MNARCQSRRVGELSYDIEDFTDKLIGLEIISPVPEKTVIWDDLNEQSASEKLDSAVKMAQVNTALVATGEVAFTGEEIRVAAGYEGQTEPLGETDEEDSETSDTAGKP